MNSYFLIRLADTDLEQITEHIAEDDIDAALVWLDETIALFQLIADTPGMAPRYERNPSLRRHPHGSYLIFYREVSGGVEIIRVLHAARQTDDIMISSS